MTDQLFDVERKVRWRGSRALVPLAADQCPTCATPLDHETVTEAPLLRHGGYGAARQSTRRHCPCGWTMLAAVSETRP